MEFIPPNPVLEFNKDQLKSVRKQYNLDKPGDMGRAIDVLEEWIKVQKHFLKKELPRNYLEKTILSSKGSLERAKMKLDKLCSLRTLMPHYFEENFATNNSDHLQNLTCLLPKPTDDNYRVFLLRATGLRFTSASFLSLYKYVVTICEHFMAYDYCDGVIIIVDFSKTSVTELMKGLNFTDMRQTNTIVNEGFELRIKAICLVTPSKAIDAFVAILKQLVSAKLAKRICVHKDINDLFQSIPKDLFPAEFGGKEKPLVELCDDLMKELARQEVKEFLEEISDAKADESCKEVQTFNEEYLGMAGSFRTLNVD